MAEVVGLALSYVSSIATLSSLLRSREQGNRTNARLLKDAEQLAESLEDSLDEMSKRKNLEASSQEQLQKLSTSLPEIRDLLCDSENRRDLSVAVGRLREEEYELRQIVSRDDEHSMLQEEPMEYCPPDLLEPPKIIVSGDPLLLHDLSHRVVGLHLVHRPMNTPVSEIVFVHGLNGDARSTWTGLGDQQVFWPRDFLVEDMGNCAIWMYSYNSDIDMTSKSKEPLGDVLKKLGNDLRFCVENQTREPLIWVAHSLGGLIVKTAMTLSSDDDQRGREDSIASRTRGIIFMGTPHAGSSLGARSARFANILSVFPGSRPAIRHESVIGELRLNSTITRTTSEFAALMDRKGFPIVSLFETKPMLTDSGPRMIVENFTSLHHPNELVGTLEGNHLTMCKFETREERGYENILKAMWIFKQSTPFLSSELTPFQRAPSPTMSKGTSASDAESIDVGTLYTNLRLRVDVPVARWTSAKAGNYEDGTWFLSSGSFQDWFIDNNGKPLLIRGPVGCGKTMIAESILEDLRGRSVAQNMTPRICHLHLFFRSDQVAQQSPLAILAALIAQTLDQNNSLARHVKRAPKLDNRNSLSQALLKGTLRQMLEDTCWAEIYLVVDALDECHASFVHASYDIISWMFDVPKLRAIFTSSTGSNVDGSSLRPYSISESPDLFSMLQVALQERKQEFDIIDLRNYDPWIDALTDYINDRLGIDGGQNSGNVSVITNLPQSSRYRLKTTLLSLPHASFSVVDLVLQDFNHRPTSLYPDQPYTVWFNEKLAGLRDTTMIYSALIDLTCRQPWPCIWILSILTCALEPLRLSEICTLWQFGLSPDMPDSHRESISTEELYSAMTSGEMPHLVTIDGDGLHLSNDLVRQTIHRQMRAAEASYPPSTAERRLSDVFEEYETMHRRIARSCLRILLYLQEIRRQKRHDRVGEQRNEVIAGSGYAERHWISHIRHAGESATQLNALVQEYYQTQSPPATSPVQEPNNAKTSRLFKRLTEDDLSVNLGSIFGDAAETVGFPDPSDIDMALNSCVPARDTLLTLRNINSRSAHQADLEKLQRSLKLDIVMAIKGQDNDALEVDINGGDFSNADRMFFLQVAIDLPNIEAADIILRHFGQASLAPMNHPTGAQIGGELLKRAVQFQNRDLVRHMLSYKHLFNMNSALIAAVEAANLGICEDLLAYGANVNVRSKSGNTTLHLAAATSSPDLVALLLRWNAAVNAVDAKQRTALHLAAECGYTDVARTLLSNSASIIARNGSGRSPFFVACTAGHRDIARLLWFSGAKLTETDTSGRSVLHAAAKEGHEEIVEMLLNAGMDAEPSDDIGVTPLHEAAEGGWAPIVERLLNAGASVETKCMGGTTGLHFACTSSNVPEAVVQLLLDRGADIRARDTLKRTPMLLAVHLSTVRVLKLFAKRDSTLLRETDSKMRGVYDYVRAADPLDGMVEKPTKKQLLEREVREANRKEKQEFLGDRPDHIHAIEEDNWKSISIRTLATEEKAKHARATESAPIEDEKDVSIRGRNSIPKT